MPVSATSRRHQTQLRRWVWQGLARVGTAMGVTQSDSPDPPLVIAMRRRRVGLASMDMSLPPIVLLVEPERPLEMSPIRLSPASSRW